jgi:hypothetical protein
VRPRSRRRARTIEAMPFQGGPMLLNFRSQASAESAGHQEIGGYSDQRLVTILAASLAVLIVAAIAVLMGMA